MRKVAVYSLFTIIVASELVAIFWIHSSKILGLHTTSVYPLKRETIAFPKAGKLQHFYENESNKVIKESYIAPLLKKPVFYTLNSDSLNERYEYSHLKPEETFRVVSLGDSWTYGIGVNTKDNYSESLEDLLNTNFTCRNFRKFEVINLAAGGYDIEYAVEEFRRRGGKYKPDLILFLIKNDDFFPHEILQPKLVHLAETSVSKGFFEDGKFVNPGQILTKSVHEEILNTLGEEEIIKYEMSALDLLSQYSRAKLLLFLYAVSPKEKAALEGFAHSQEHIFLYEHPILSDDKKIQNDGHPNEGGHMIFAREIYKFILQNTLIPCD